MLDYSNIIAYNIDYSIDHSIDYSSVKIKRIKYQNCLQLS